MPGTKSPNENSLYVASNRIQSGLDARVVIVGAGLAGLAAGQRLIESGINDIFILEGQDRIGGRVHTIQHSDYLLELGAQWLHGADENPLYQWLTDKNMLDDFEDASMGFRGVFCTNEGQLIEPSLVKRVLDIAIESKLALSKNRFIDMIDAYDLKNAGQVFEHYLDSKVATDEVLSKNKSQVYAIFEWFLKYEAVENGCDTMDNVSVSSYTDWTDWGDGTMMNFKNGYQSLLAWFCKNLGDDSISLNTKVDNIETLTHQAACGGWLDGLGQVHDKPVIVRYSTKSESGLIECDHVIVTVSLGFLKRHQDTFFTPPISQQRRDLISSIGFGTVNKIVLQFSSPFWEEKSGIKPIWIGSSCNDLPEWSRDIIAFDVVRRQPNLLIGWIAGRGAELMEKETDEEIARTCLKIMERFLPKEHPRPSQLEACICSRWNSNPFTCGSYSYQSIKSFNKNIDKLHEPIYSSDTNRSSAKLKAAPRSRVPRVLFAGEATGGKLYSTTHGAIISGWREADRLKDFLPVSDQNNMQQLSDTNSICNRMMSS